MRDGRLKAVYELLGEAGTVADVGCDHGFLSAELILSGSAERVIASDVSQASVKKAAALAEGLGIEDRMTVSLADGLASVTGEEKGLRIAICGMGGELIARILEDSREKANKAELIVMQPMRGEAELRRYLYENGFGIADEMVVLDDGRYYQVIAAVPGRGNDIPEGFPKDFFRFGWVMAKKREKELLPLLLHYRAVYEAELKKAEKCGRAPEKLVSEIEKTDALIAFVKEKKGMKLNDLLAAMESIAPKELALDFDNPGLIVGTDRKEIKRALVALDCTVSVAEEAAAKGCDIVITHHPLLFRAVKRIDPADPVTAPVWKLIRNGVAMFAAHTNLDSAEGGVNTTLCRLLGIVNEEPVPPENLCRVGELETETTFTEFVRKAEEVLHTKARAAGPERSVRRVMVCGGSGGSEYPLAAACGADVLLTGECRHNEAIEAVCAGVNVVVCGHYETESIVLRPLIERLRELAPEVEFLLSEEGAPLRVI